MGATSSHPAPLIEVSGPRSKILVPAHTTFAFAPTPKGGPPYIYTPKRPSPFSGPGRYSQQYSHLRDRRPRSPFAFSDLDSRLDGGLGFGGGALSDISFSDEFEDGHGHGHGHGHGRGEFEYGRRADFGGERERRGFSPRARARGRPGFNRGRRATAPPAVERGRNPRVRHRDTERDTSPFGGSSDDMNMNEGMAMGRPGGMGMGGRMPPGMMGRMGGGMGAGGMGGGMGGMDRPWSAPAAYQQMGGMGGMGVPGGNMGIGGAAGANPMGYGAGAGGAAGYGANPYAYGQQQQGGAGAAMGMGMGMHPQQAQQGPQPQPPPPQREYQPDQRRDASRGAARIGPGSYLPPNRDRDRSPRPRSPKYQASKSKQRSSSPSKSDHPLPSLNACICSGNCTCKMGHRVYYFEDRDDGGEPLRGEIRYVLKDDVGKDCGDHSKCYSGDGRRKGKMSVEEMCRASGRENRERMERLGEGLGALSEKLDRLGGPPMGEGGERGGMGIANGGQGMQQAVNASRAPYGLPGPPPGGMGMGMGMGMDPMQMQRRLAAEAAMLNGAGGHPQMAQQGMGPPPTGMPQGMPPGISMGDPRRTAQMAAMMANHGDMDSEYGPPDMGMGMMDPMMGAGRRPHPDMMMGRRLGRMSRPPPEMMGPYGGRGPPPPMGIGMGRMGMPPRGGRPHPRPGPGPGPGPGGRRPRPEFPPDEDIDMPIRRGGRGDRGGEFGDIGEDDDWEDMGEDMEDFDNDMDGPVGRNIGSPSRNSARRGGRGQNSSGRPSARGGRGRQAHVDDEDEE